VRLDMIQIQGHRPVCATFCGGHDRILGRERVSVYSYLFS